MTLLDVREDWEVKLGAGAHAAPCISPWARFRDRLGEFDAKKETVVICRSGGRSAQVAEFLRTPGFRLSF